MKELLLSSGISLAFALFLTPVFARLFTRWNWGQFIREDGPQSHHVKRGTPTMGGIVFILATLVGYFAGKLIWWIPPTYTALVVLFLFVGLGVVGFIDDFLKTHNQRSLGLGGWAKVAGQVVVGVVFAVLAVSFPNQHGQTPANTAISFVRDIPWLDFAPLGIAGLAIFVVWVVLIVVATSNAVNVTDGLDGLATGSSILAIGGFALIGFWQFNQSCLPGGALDENLYRCYDTRDPLDIAVLAACIVGALIGFLWWNTNPAQIIMGDTGSLALGGALAALAIVTHTQLLLLLIGGLFIIETGSVILQRLYFKLTKGKRIFLMTPIHHSFELKGWKEVTIVVRFWLIAALFVLAGVAVFYSEWTSFRG